MWAYYVLCLVYARQFTLLLNEFVLNQLQWSKKNMKRKTIKHQKVLITYKKNKFQEWLSANAWNG